MTTALPPPLGVMLQSPVVAALLEATRVGVAVLDRELRIVAINPALSELAGRATPALVVGRTLRELGVHLGKDAEASARSVLTTGAPLLGLSAPPPTLDESGWSFDVLPLRDPQGTVAGVFLLAHAVEAAPVFEADARRDEAQLVANLAAIGRSIVAEHELEKVVQRLTDEGVSLSGAAFGAFFYTAVDDRGETFVLHALSGAPREAFASFGLPRNTALFGPTFRGEATVRCDDVTRDPRYGKNAPFAGLPSGHLQVRSYLAVPVRAPTGGVLGGLFFGHPLPGMFTARAERLVEAVAVYAGIAMENARLLADTQAALARVAHREVEVRTITDALPALVAYVDRSERYQWVNHAYTEWFGLRADEIQGQRLVELLGDPAIAELRPHVDAVLLRGERVEFDGVIPYRHGGERHVQGRYVPQVGPDGDVVGFISLVVDVTAQRAAEAERQRLLEAERAARAEAEASRARAAFLAEASNVLASSLDHERTLGDVARLAVPVLADGCVIDLVDASGDRRRVAAEGASGGASGGDRVIRVVPIRARGRLLGELTLAAEREYGPADLEVMDDLAGRIALAVENAQLYESVRRADRAKEEFLAMLAHELRNPLAPILTAMQLLRIKGPAAADRVQQVVERQAAHLTRLVDDLLEVSRLGRGKIQLRCEVIDVVALVRDVAGDHTASAERAGLTLTVEVPGERLPVRADATRLAQVIGNLLANAMKFTDRGGRITVSLSRVGPRARLSVRDTGIGISREVLNDIFEPFAQADRSLDRSRGGLGLGLTVVRGIVELHDGAVRARSDGPGRGSEFTVELPLADDVRPAEPGVASSPSSASPGLRVLVVEDNHDAAVTLRDLLETCGHQVALAPDGPTALSIAPDLRPHLVLCDIGLPGLDGYAVGRALRAMPEGAAARLVAITGYGQEEDRRRALDAGFDVHLTKPVSLAQLEALLVST